MNRIAGDRFIALSAGSRPKDSVHPMTIEVLSEMEIDTSDLRPKSVEEFKGQVFDYIITLSDDAKEEAPIFPGEPLTAHWGFEDPAEAKGDDAHIEHIFDDLAMDIEHRIRLFLTLPEDQLDRMEYHAAIKDIGMQTITR